MVVGAETVRLSKPTSFFLSLRFPRSDRTPRSETDLGGRALAPACCQLASTLELYTHWSRVDGEHGLVELGGRDAQRVDIDEKHGACCQLPSLQSSPSVDHAATVEGSTNATPASSRPTSIVNVSEPLTMPSMPSAPVPAAQICSPCTAMSTIPGNESGIWVTLPVKLTRARPVGLGIRKEGNGESATRTQRAGCCQLWQRRRLN